MANSTMIAQEAISFKDMTTTPRPKFPKNSLGFAGITYIESVSDMLKKQLLCHAPDLKISFCPASKVSQVFSNIKDKLETEQNSNVVYSIPCLQCGRSYIGETSRTLCERCEQHKKDVQNKEKKPKKTALVAHVTTTKHEFDFNQAKVIKKVRARGLLKIHEANHIILNEGSTVNFKKDAKHVSPVFYNLIRKKMKDKKLKRFNPMNTNTQHLNETSAANKSEQTSDSVEHMYIHTYI